MARLEHAGELHHNREPVGLWNATAGIARRVAERAGPALLRHSIAGCDGWQKFHDALTTGP
jgi:hypothetical protein